MFKKREDKNRGSKPIKIKASNNTWFTSRYSKKYNTEVMVFNPLRKFWKGNDTNKVSIA
ncbi:MAG TPA: hypothetical protein VK806_12045 [Bacteroidia bacterium]|jgi:hypothetical protein|nr:hypothetical protein [Bacteroidia bacterium]